MPKSPSRVNDWPFFVAVMSCTNTAGTKHVLRAIGCPRAIKTEIARIVIVFGVCFARWHDQRIEIKPSRHGARANAPNRLLKLVFAAGFPGALGLFGSYISNTGLSVPCVPGR